MKTNSIGHALKSNMIVTAQKNFGEYGYCIICNADMQTFIGEGFVRHYKSFKIYRSRFGKLAVQESNNMKTMFTVYAQKVKTSDEITLKLWPKTKKEDVAIYRQNGSLFAIFPWYYASKPKKNWKHVMLNCFRWNLIWK